MYQAAERPGLPEHISAHKATRMADRQNINSGATHAGFFFFFFLVVCFLFCLLTV